MKVVSLAAGAAGMYCGSCLRDNRLAATLIDQGRDLVLIPLYTPLRTEDADVSTGRIFYGGINVYLQQRSALFRHTPWVLDRLLDSPALLRGVGRFAAKTRAEELGRLTVSVLQGQDGPQRKELDKLIAHLRTLRPDVINLPNLMMLGLAARLKDALGPALACTLTGEDLFLDQLPEPYRRQAFDLVRERAADVDGFLSVTRYYAAHAVEHFGLAPDRVHYVPMGIRVDDFAQAARPADEPFTIGYLARICPEKGLASLCEAFAQLRREGRECRLRVAGYLADSDKAYYQGVKRFVSEHSLCEQVEFLGELDKADKVRFLQSLHAFSVPTVYHEAKGFPVLEALASGVPVVQPRHGSFPELIEAAGGGLLYDPDEPGALAAALARLMDDAKLGEQLAANGRSGVRRSFSAEVMADQAWQVYRALAGRGRP